MSVPTDVGRIEFYEGDPLNVRISFTLDGEPVDVSESTITVSLRGTVDPTLDVSEADAGKVYLRFTREQTRALAPTSTFDVAETPLWDRTMVRGTLVKRSEVS